VLNLHAQERSRTPRVDDTLEGNGKRPGVARTQMTCWDSGERGPQVRRIDDAQAIARRRGDCVSVPNAVLSQRTNRGWGKSKALVSVQEYPGWILLDANEF